MKFLFQKILICIIVLFGMNMQDASAQSWTFPYPTVGTMCLDCSPDGWTIVDGSPDVSDLTTWTGFPHYYEFGEIPIVPEPTPGVTSFMSGITYEAVETSFILDEPRVLTIYFAGFGTNSSGGGPINAHSGYSESVLVNGIPTYMDIPWDGEWHPIEYDLPAGLNTIYFSPIEPYVEDGLDSRSAVHISIPAEQIADCEHELIPELIPDFDVCFGEELTLDVTSESGALITWDMGVINGVPFTPSETGTYIYSATSEEPLDCPYSIAITIHDLPTIVAGPDIIVCEGDDVTLEGTGAGIGGSYSWSDGVVDGIAFVPPLATSVYTVIGIDAFGCENSDEITVTVNEHPIIEAGPDMVICFGDEAILEGDGAGIGGDYDWTDGVLDGILFTPGATTTYTVTGTDIYGCWNTDEVTITLNPLPLIDAGIDREICEGEEVTLNAVGAGLGGTYTWSGGVEDGEAFMPGTTTTYTVTGTDGEGCVNTDDILVTVHILPAVNAGADLSICEGDEVTLVGSGAGIGGVYVWSDGVENAISFIPLTSETYTVNGTDVNGCENEDEMTITVNAYPIVSFTGDVLIGCYPHAVNFNTGSVGASYEWTFGDGGLSNLEDPDHTYYTDGEYNVMLTVTSAAGCATSVEYVEYISIVIPPKADFSYKLDEIDLGVADVLFENESEYAIDYLWNFGDGSASTNLIHPSHIFDGMSETGYTVQLIAENAIGCRDTVSKWIKMKDNLIYYVPNAFTPDGNGFNDEFKPVFVAGFDYYDFHMTIFNRWGEKVFESYNSDYGWNGFYGDKGLVDDGVYVWHIEFGDINSDKRYVEGGYVTILK